MPSTDFSSKHRTKKKCLLPSKSLNINGNQFSQVVALLYCWVANYPKVNGLRWWRKFSSWSCHFARAWWRHFTSLPFILSGAAYDWGLEYMRWWSLDVCWDPCRCYHLKLLHDASPRAAQLLPSKVSSSKGEHPKREKEAEAKNLVPFTPYGHTAAGISTLFSS